MSAGQRELFGGPALPEGMQYRAGFLSAAEEAGLLGELARLPLEEARHRQYVARRRIALFEPEVPPFLLPLRARVAQWAGEPAEAFAHALVNEYRPGTPLGWHRDAPEYGTVAGVSLGARCVMRLRPWPPAKGRDPRSLSIVLEPRSAYVLRGPARTGWQHAVSATKALRYSVTFRTRRAGIAGRGRGT